MQPDIDAIAGFDRGAIIATAPGDTSDIVIRVFAPKLGLPEDPVCGTAHRILAPYWAARLGRTELHSRQLSARGGDLYCRIEGDTVSISGESRTFLAGIPPPTGVGFPNCADYGGATSAFFRGLTPGKRSGSCRSPIACTMGRNKGNKSLANLFRRQRQSQCAALQRLEDLVLLDRR